MKQVWTIKGNLECGLLSCQTCCIKLRTSDNSGNPHLETEPTSMILKRLAAALRTYDYFT